MDRRLNDHGRKARLGSPSKIPEKRNRFLSRYTWRLMRGTGCSSGRRKPVTQDLNPWSSQHSVAFFSLEFSAATSTAHDILVACGNLSPECSCRVAALYAVHARRRSASRAPSRTNSVCVWTSHYGDRGPPFCINLRHNRSIEVGVGSVVRFARIVHSLILRPIYQAVEQAWRTSTWTLIRSPFGSCCSYGWRIAVVPKWTDD